MAQHSDHFFSLPVFTPADVIVYIAGTKSHGISGIQNMFQAFPDRDTIGGIRQGFLPHTGNAEIFLQAGDQAPLLGQYHRIQIHNLPPALY